ncbi:MAG: hypothetical protein KA715_03675 [Xanthomonadaceae bacterium]|nr:hypothetical protein [Xanthomonadaceae bacterium]
MSACSNCRKSNATSQCGCCNEPVCKNCIEFLKEGSFSFLQKIPQELTHTQYCPSCFQKYVTEAQTKYEETMELAREVYIFYIGRKGNLPLFEQSKKKLSIPKCTDRDEILLRLAFQAAEMGFNAITETDVIRIKVRDGAYQTMSFSVSGFPAKIDVTKIDRH